MATLKEFAEALRERGLDEALAVLDGLKARDRARRTVAPARRVAGTKMTPELARRVLHLHATTGMTQQEIAFQLGVNQGRVNEVVKRGKWLSDDPAAPEARARDRALERAARGEGVAPRARRARAPKEGLAPAAPPPPPAPATAPSLLTLVEVSPRGDEGEAPRAPRPARRAAGAPAGAVHQLSLGDF